MPTNEAKMNKSPATLAFLLSEVINPPGKRTGGPRESSPNATKADTVPAIAAPSTVTLDVATGYQPVGESRCLMLNEE